ncbi:hypothetical protein BKA70DRAFT_1318486 [Coprinopsis sp. MPI-PUGE-AT-0042]|nr:hypothetical protein BKA70DRAFT_1318486 [Coprinopsis sp. MPI-PUGE-AT-0042]
MSTSLHSLLDIFSCFLYFASIVRVWGTSQANAGFGLALCPIGMRGENCLVIFISQQLANVRFPLRLSVTSCPFASVYVASLSLLRPPSLRIACNDLTDTLAYVYKPDCTYVATVHLASPTHLKRPPLV